ncbi:MAG: 3-dehydroquinate synthase [Bacillales bacterium]|nr:3-dehydroquinate synthase [Bacillales bacterium]
MIINIELQNNSYPIYIEKDGIKNLHKYFNLLEHKVLIVSDSNIPFGYIKTIQDQCTNSYYFIIKAGEESKSIDNYLTLQKILLEKEFSRKDIIIGLGGGVVGDLTAFVASTFKRGIPFINIPTSSLAMIDSSIGGKTAINYLGIKNCIGTFYQPKLVIIDFNLLKSLPIRHLNNGLIEALKAGYIYDSSIIDLFKDDPYKNLEEIIIRSIKVKKHYVEIDEKELNERKILNYGHTFGHALESYFHFSDSLYHGEAVAIGMLLISDEKEELLQILKKLNIHLNDTYDYDKIIELIKNDKKVDKEYVDLILRKNKVGVICPTKIDRLKEMLIGGEQYVRCLRK